MFFDDLDRWPFLGSLGERLAAEDCALHAYVLMIAMGENCRKIILTPFLAFS
jgi:hypothetical protein